MPPRGAIIGSLLKCASYMIFLARRITFVQSTFLGDYQNDDISFGLVRCACTCSARAGGLRRCFRRNRFCLAETSYTRHSRYVFQPVSQYTSVATHADGSQGCTKRVPWVPKIHICSAPLIRQTISHATVEIDTGPTYFTSYVGTGILITTCVFDRIGVMNCTCSCVLSHVRGSI